MQTDMHLPICQTVVTPEMNNETKPTREMERTVMVNIVVTEPNGEIAGIGDNSELNDDQKRALFFHHRRLYKHALAKKKEADAAFKDACKRAKAENADPKMIKFSIELENDEDGKIAAEHAERERVASFMCLPIGANGDFFDRTPLVDRAFDEGKRAGMEGETCIPPYDASGEAGQAWINGWHEGQKALVSTLELFRSKDAPELIKAEEDDDFDGDELEDA